MSTIVFHKYHALENDMIVVDLRENAHEAVYITSIGASLAQRLCHRRTGIGADCLLMVKPERHFAQVNVYNADGSAGSVCINGARCIAHYVAHTYDQPNPIKITMGSRDIIASICDTNTIELTLEAAQSIHPQKFGNSETGIFSGYFVDTGNPHGIIFTSNSPDWLIANGHLLSTYNSVSQALNISLIATAPSTCTVQKFSLITYERGCGVTAACGSAAAAAHSVLCTLQYVQPEEKIVFMMRGGALTSVLNHDHSITQYATAHAIYQGTVCLKN